MDTTRNQSDTRVTKNTRKGSITFMVELALLVAIELIMIMTPLGYLQVGLVQISFLAVPVAIGAIVLGPTAGVVLGLVFGISSLLQPSGMAMLGVIPVQSAVLAIVPRLFVGLIPGLVFKGLSKTKMPKPVSVSISCLLAPLTNSILYCAFMVIFVGDYMATINPAFEYMTQFGFWKCYGILLAGLMLNIVLEAFAGLIVASAVSNVLLHTVNKSR